MATIRTLVPAVVVLAMAGSAAFSTVVQAAEKGRAPPNVVYFIIDELGYFEPGFNGGRTIRTPNMDRMAAEGMRLPNMLAGSAVCAPTRCCLLTGKHSGHTSVRVNGGGTPLRADEVTIASMLKPLGYATGGFGKWGNGGRDSTGVPEKHGFDVFFGYYDQVHAHTYYPAYLIRNSEEVPLPGNNGGSKGRTYSQYVIHAAALEFIREHRERPFFAYLPYTPPHGNFDIPDDDPAWSLYKDKPWPEPARRYAAMVGMVDRQVGEVLALLKELNLDENTVVMFSGDNGGADYFTSAEFPRGVHSANKNPSTGVEYRGKKGDLHEGGLRVPFVVRWPGHVKAGSESGFLGYFPDVMPTIAEITGAKAPADIDGISFLPTLIGAQAAGHPQQQHQYLYWEMGDMVAIRQGDWRGHKSKSGWALYDLGKDPGESKDLAAAHPDVLKRLVNLAAAAHAPAVEGTFSRTDRHERDRRTKTGRQDDPDAPDPLTGRKKKRNAVAVPQEGMLSNKGWTIVRASSENTDNGKFAKNAIDGDPDTLWHSRFAGQVARPPHELVIDLGGERTISGFVYLGRQDGGWNGAIKDVEIRVGMSPDTFGEPLVTTRLEKSRQPQRIECRPTQGRYVLLRALSEHDGNPFATVAELGVLGR